MIKKYIAMWLFFVVLALCAWASMVNAWLYFMPHHTNDEFSSFATNLLLILILFAAIATNVLGDSLDDKNNR